MTEGKNNIKRFFIIILLVLIVLLCLFLSDKLLFPVFGTEKNFSQVDQKKSLTIINYTQSSQLDVFLLTLINDRCADTDVSVRSYSLDYYYEIANANLISDNGPDIFMVEHPAIIDNLIPSSQLVAVNDLLDLDWRRNMDVYMHNNTMYVSPPVGIDTYTLYFNQDLLFKISVSMDEPSVNDLIAICKKAQENGFTGISLGTRSRNSIKKMFIQLCGGSPKSERLNIALNNYIALSNFVTRKSYLYDNDDAKDMFIRGEACFYFGMSSEMDQICRNSSFTVGQTFISDDDRCIAWFDYFGMSAICKTSPNKIVALDALKTISGSSAREAYVEFIAQNTVPCDVHAFESVQPLCNWMYDDNGQNLSEYIELFTKLQNAVYPLEPNFALNGDSDQVGR